MRKIIGLVSVLGMLTIGNVNATSCIPDTNVTIIDKTKVKLKLMEGRNMYLTYNYRGALKQYRSALKLYPTSGLVNYRIAEAQYALRKYDLAKKYCEKASKLDSDVDKELHLLLGKIYHRLEDLDKAIVHYNKFKESASDKDVADNDVNLIIAQCHKAKKMMKKPVDVKIENLGQNINSAGPEYSPSVSSDGKKIIFTSRRADTKGGMVDVNFDHNYYEDVYMSEWDEDLNGWGDAESVPGKLNTEYHDAALNITPDGKQIYIYRNIEGATRSGDIYVSKMGKSGKWGAPKPAGGKEINSSYFESSASLTADGNIMFFVSDRPGGQGQADIYMVRKIGKDWSEPHNIGENINTDLDEKFVFVHPSGKILFFSSEGHDGMGGYDIYMSRYANGVWGDPVNVGYPINTVNEEKTFTVTSDGKTAYVGAFYKDGYGDSDIFKVDISSMNILEGIDWDPSTGMVEK